MSWAAASFLDELCPNLTQNAAKVRHLRAMGLTVIVATNGCPKVLQSNVDRVFGGAEQALQFAKSVDAGPQPKANRAGLRMLLGGKAA